MSNTPTPADRFARILRALTHAAVTQRIVGRLSMVLTNLVVDRLRTAIQNFNRIAAMVRAGTWRPRRSGPRRQRTARTQAPPSAARQQFGWLDPAIPEVAHYRGNVLDLLQDPEMLALIEAAPAAMRRLFRPLCWALKLKPPPILAIPRKAPPLAPAPAPAATPNPPAPAPARPPRPARPAPPRALGPPHPA